MAGYSELIYTLGAMIIFSMILLTANRLTLRDARLQVEGELEEEVVAVAQTIIEESRVLAFDEITEDGIPPVNAPDDFTYSSNFGTKRSDEGDESLNDRTSFTDFDDFDGWKDSITIEGITYNLSAKVRYVNSSTYDSTSAKTNFKRIYVQVRNEYLNKNGGKPIKYEFSYIRNYYAD
ncbi:MAG: hypothetical protein U5K69_16670 [Balneolaceae bacterium]|nr:hypothetical protein [Balneolaceae bacterium]